MATIDVGYRKLFRVRECVIDIPETSSHTVALGDGLITRITIGDQPSLYTEYPANERDFFPMQGPDGAVSGIVHVVPLPTGPEIIYLEVVVFRTVRVDNKAFSAWEAGEDVEASRVLQNRAKEERKSTVIGADMIAAILGLRFHRQIVLDPVTDSLFVSSRKRCTTWPALPSGDVLHHLAVTRDALRGELFTKITAEEYVRITPYAPTLSWLLKAWKERDSQTRFIALFIALELLLEHYTTDRTPPMENEAKTIKRLIWGKADPAERASLVRYFDKLYSDVRNDSNSLTACFARLAMAANFPTKDEDIETFDHARRKRNALMHRGEEVTRLGEQAKTDGIAHPLSVYGEISEMDSLVVRYVTWALYGETHIFPGTKPPQP